MNMISIFEKWDGILFSLYNLIVRIVYIIKYPSIRIIRKNKALRNRHKGERCYIVLNGPSINQYDLSYLKNETVFATNFFFRAPICEVVDPNYYCWLDSKRLADPGVTDLVRDIKRSCPNAELLLNYKAFPFLGEKEGIHYAYAKHISNYYSTKINISGLCSNFFTVAFFAITSAMYMGFKEIYVLGLDFEPMGFTHFTHLGNDSVNSMPGQKIAKGEVAGDYWQYAMAQYQSYALNEVAKKKGCNIYNLNHNSYIRAFDFIESDGICPKKDSNK